MLEARRETESAIGRSENYRLTTKFWLISRQMGCKIAGKDLWDSDELSHEPKQAHP